MVTKTGGYTTGRRLRGRAQEGCAFQRAGGAGLLRGTETISKSVRTRGRQSGDRLRHLSHVTVALLWVYLSFTNRANVEEHSDAHYYELVHVLALGSVYVQFISGVKKYSEDNYSVYAISSD